jgi:hypothetical protein
MVSLHRGFPTKVHAHLSTPMRFICPVYHTFLNWNRLTIFGEEHKS